MNKTTVINLFGGSGIGKSTQAAHLFYHLKCLGHSAEYVNEYIKEHIWANRKDVIRSDTDIKQDYIFAKQHKKQYILQGKVDYIITDSPLPLSAFYAYKDELYPYLEGYVIGCFNRFNNINILLKRNPELPFQTEGRLQKTVEEAIQLDNTLKIKLYEWNIPFTEIVVGDNFVPETLSIIEYNSGRLAN